MRGEGTLNLVVSADSRAVAMSLIAATHDGGDIEVKDHGLWHGWKDE